MGMISAKNREELLQLFRKVGRRLPRLSQEEAFEVPDLCDPEGDDEDDGCPPDVKAVLGFDPDEP